MIRRLLTALDIGLTLLRVELVLHRARRDRLRARVAELERRVTELELGNDLDETADYAAFRHDARARFTTSAAVTPTRSPRSPDRRDGGTSPTARPR
jgi:hypothetical protein